MKNETIQEALREAGPHRRRFLKKLSFAGAAMGMGTQLASGQTTTPTDIDILNFALNLEYLEAEFYTLATTGQTIDALGYTTSGAGTQGPATGGAQVPFGTPDTYAHAAALELARDERTHVALLQDLISTLGGQAIAQPAINLNALGFGFASVQDFLKLARIFEDVGVTAYAGAAPLITSKTVLGYAARVLGAEAEHSGNIRLLVDQYNVATTPVDGADIIPLPSGSQLFSLNSMALVETRTPGQVLYLVFGGTPNAMSGGFFPNGVNGNLTTASATPATNDGATLVASPNPIPVTSSQYGVTTITWNAPGASIIQIRVGSPNGALFTDNGPSGSMTTGGWVDNGTQFYLQDVSNGKALTPANTLAVVTVNTTT